MKLSDIRLRDPFILPVPETRQYWLFGTTDITFGTGFDCFLSGDLENWTGPFPAFRPPAGFGPQHEFWAPECHRIDGAFYLFATFKEENRCRGTWILRSDRPEGPYKLWSDGAVTPHDRECLDGTFHQEPDGSRWMVFCHEWVQIGDGTVCAMRLRSDLKGAAEEPVLLFQATEAPWVRPFKPGCFVTDGPFLHTAGGALRMLWSSFGAKGYATGVAESESGAVTGPWRQIADPVFDQDGGHAMCFETFSGARKLVLHQPNVPPLERAVIRDFRF